MPIKSYFGEKNISNLIKQFWKKGFTKNSVVSQNIKKRLFYFSLRIETHNYRRVAIFEIPKKNQNHSTLLHSLYVYRHIYRRTDS